MTPDENNGRSRTYSWQNPAQTTEAARKQTGLEFFNDMITGQHPQPPIAHTLDFALTEADEGTAVFKIDCSEFHYNPLGTVHGGRRIATTEGKLVDANVKLYAHGTTTCFIFST